MSKQQAARPRTPLGWVLTGIGIVIIALTLVLALFMAAPTLLGWQQMNVLTGSMEPEIPIGSLVYVAPAEPEELAEGDVITFSQFRGDTVTHRVVRNRTVEGLLTTKGDANAEEDVEPVPYDRVIGKVVFTLPGAGDVLGYASSDLGKVYLLAFGACGVMFVILGGRLRKAV